MANSIIPESWPIPDQLRKRFGTNIGRQRSRMVDGHLLIGLHACPEKGAKNRAGRVFWRSPAGVWTGSITEPSIVSLEVHLAEYEKAAVAYEEREDRCANAKRDHRLKALS